MWLARGHTERREAGNGLVAVAIDKDRGSQNALKYATDHLLSKDQTLILLHVNLKTPTLSASVSLTSPKINHISDMMNSEHTSICRDPDPRTKDLLLPFRCFCSRKAIQCKDVVLEDTDVSKALIEYVTHAAIETLVIGSSSRSGFLRFKAIDIPGTVSKGAPDFCTVYVISKGKISSMRSASRPAPAFSTLRTQLLSQSSHRSDMPEMQIHQAPSIKGSPERPPMEALHKSSDDIESFRSPFTRKGFNGKWYGEITFPDTDISYVSSGRPSMDRIFPSAYDSMEISYTGRNQRLSYSADIDNSNSFESMQIGRRSVDVSSPSEFSSHSQDSGGRLSSSSSSQTMEDVEAEMRRLKLELKQTMEMYSTACKEALTAKQKAKELQRWKLEEEQRLEEARLAEEAALAVAEREKAKSKAAIEAAEASQRIAELEAQKRINAEMKALRESEEKRKALDALAHSDIRYRKYSIEEIEAATEFFSESRKIGEGGYGPVYKCNLDHTPVAIKVLRPDAAQGRSQFQQEV